MLPLVFSRVWQRGSPFVYKFFLRWVNYSTKQLLSNADPRYPSSAGCYRDISTTRCWQNSRTHAYKFDGKTIDAKVLTGWSLSSSASLVTEPRRPDLRILFTIQTDFTTNMIGTEVKKLFTIQYKQLWWMIKIKAKVTKHLSLIWTTAYRKLMIRDNCTKRSLVTS